MGVIKRRAQLGSPAASVEAGLNVRTAFTPPEQFALPLRQLVREGALSMEMIDARVRDVLRVKYWLGLFDQPYRADPGEADRVVRAPAHLAVAHRAARESIVLLKNEGALLPLRTDLRRVLVAGPLADDGQAWWSRYGPQQLDFVTVLDGIRRRLGPGVEVRYAQGVAAKDEHFPESDVYKEPPSEAVRAGIAEAVAAAKDVDLIVAALGVNWVARHVAAIVEIWFPGEEGAAGCASPATSPTPEPAPATRSGRWSVEPGRFTVMVGASSADIRLQGALEIVARTVGG